MKLLTKEIISRLPATEDIAEKDPSETMVIAKFFTPWSNWTWFVVSGEAVLSEDNRQPTGDYLLYC